MDPVKLLDQAISDRFALYHGDAIEIVAELPDESIDYSIFSPPFASLYTYTNSERDLGNCTDYEQFSEHFGFLVGDLLRVIKPGRLLSFHCMNLPMSKTTHGEIGIQDFRGDLIRIFRDAGWIFHSEVCIWKDPVMAMQRTKALGLLWKQLKKDSCMSRQGIPDYLVTMRKPGVNTNPVSHDPEEFPVDLWQKYASPVWMDINPSRTLQYTAAREENDERHICIARGSLVLTADGHKPIEEVELGDLVLTHKGRWRPVTAKACMGVKPVVKICAQGVPGLTTTPEHKLWTRNSRGLSHPRIEAIRTNPDWMEAEKTKGSYINLKLPPIEESEYSAHDWWVVGRWLSDGHFDARGHAHVSCGDQKFNDLVTNLSGRRGAVTKVRTGYQIAVSDPDGKLKSLLRRCGRGAAGKKLPREALSLNQELSEVLLAGYLSGDGHYVAKYDRWSASSVSRSLLLGMAMVAQRARGVACSVYAGRSPGTKTIEGRTVNTKQDWILSIPPRNISGIMLDDGAWKKVRSVEQATEAEVWDITVEEDASFTVEGCVVKNCPLQLDVIERALRLWSNPGDVVLSPFAGIGSEGVASIEMGRRFVGVELKQSYFAWAAKNLARAEAKANEPRLFSLTSLASLGSEDGTESGTEGIGIGSEDVGLEFSSESVAERSEASEAVL